MKRKAPPTRPRSASGVSVSPKTIAWQPKRARTAPARSGARQGERGGDEHLDGQGETQEASCAEAVIEWPRDESARDPAEAIGRQQQAEAARIEAEALLRVEDHDRVLRHQRQIEGRQRQRQRS